MKKVSVLLLSLLVSVSAVAQMASVSVWQIAPGRNQEALAMARMMAPVIAEISDSQLSVGIDQFNRLHWVQVFENWEDWGKSGDAWATDNSDKFAEVRANFPRTTPPLTTLVDRFEINIVKPSDPNFKANVTSVTKWDAQPGRLQESIATGRKFVDAHEKLGSSVSISADSFGNSYYALNFESFTAMGQWIEKSRASEEIRSIMASMADQERVAEVAARWRIRWIVRPGI